jgi:hypothetical protein
VEDSIQRGHNYLFGVIVAIVLLQIITNITDDMPLSFSLIRMSILFVLFNYLLKGFPWSKWVLSIYLLLVGIGGLWVGSYLVLNKSVLQNNLSIGILSGIIGALYILALILIHMFKDIRVFLAHQKESRLRESIRNHMANILLYIGVAVIICIEVEMLPLTFSRVIQQPQLTKKIFGLIFLLPVKIPYYAIPGLILIFIGRLINNETA